MWLCTCCLGSGYSRSLRLRAATSMRVGISLPPLEMDVNQVAHNGWDRVRAMYRYVSTVFCPGRRRNRISSHGAPCPCSYLLR